MDNNLFQELADIIVDDTIVEWDKIVFYAMYSEGGYTMKYFIKNNKTNYIDCFNYNNANRLDLLKKFINIDKIISKYRDFLPQKDKWTLLTFIINKKGEFKVEYDYHNYDKKLLTWETKWQKKYLK